MEFTKLQGAGNDFILIEGRNVSLDYSKLARIMCDRHFGIGADGLLELLPSDTAEFRMRMFNPNGSEAEACGNGLRCLARYVYDRGLVESSVEAITIETMAGIRKVKLYKAGGELAKIQVNMGTPRFRAEDIPVILGSGEGTVDIKPILDYPVTVEDIELRLNFVSMGNPHAVYFSSEPVSDFPLFQLGPKVEHLKIFPERVNFGVAHVLNRHQIEARVWERGAGGTLACGSGACAIGIIAQLHGYVDHNVEIKMPGGGLEIEWDGVGEVFLSGPAKVVFTGKWLGEV